MKPKLVQLVWHDAHSISETWTSKSEIESQPCIVSSVGWLIPHAKPDHVVICQSMILGQDSLDNCLAIPNGMVKQVHRLKATRILLVEIPDES